MVGAKCIKMRRFACYNLKFFRRLCPRTFMLAPLPIPHPFGNPALRASHASLEASIVDPPMFVSRWRHCWHGYDVSCRINAVKNATCRCKTPRRRDKNQIDYIPQMKRTAFAGNKQYVNLYAHFHIFSWYQIPTLGRLSLDKTTKKSLWVCIFCICFMLLLLMWIDELNK